MANKSAASQSVKAKESGVKCEKCKKEAKLLTPCDKLEKEQKSSLCKDEKRQARKLGIKPFLDKGWARLKHSKSIDME